MNYSVIKIFRIAKGMTAKELAKSVNISASYLCFMERGKDITPDPDILNRICEQLDMKKEDFYGIINLYNKKDDKKTNPLEKTLLKLAAKLAKISD